MNFIKAAHPDLHTNCARMEESNSRTSKWFHEIQRFIYFHVDLVISKRLKSKAFFGQPNERKKQLQHQQWRRQQQTNERLCGPNKFINFGKCGTKILSPSRASCRVTANSFATCDRFPDAVKHTQAHTERERDCTVYSEVIEKNERCFSLCVFRFDWKTNAQRQIICCFFQPSTYDAVSFLRCAVVIISFAFAFAFADRLNQILIKVM